MSNVVNVEGSGDVFHERFELIDTTAGGLTLGSINRQLIVSYPPIDLVLPIGVGEELVVHYLLHEGHWVSLRRPEDNSLVFEAGAPPVRCGIDSVDTQFCVVRTGDAFCRFESGTRYADAKVEFKTDQGAVRLGPAESTEVTKDGRRFRAEVFSVVAIEPTSGDGLTEFAQALLIALE